MSTSVIRRVATAATTLALLGGGALAQAPQAQAAGIGYVVNGASTYNCGSWIWTCYANMGQQVSGAQWATMTCYKDSWNTGRMFRMYVRTNMGTTWTWIAAGSVPVQARVPGC